MKNTTRAIIGAIAYKLIGGIAIDLGLNPNDLRAVNALIVIIFISYNNFAIDFLKFSNKKKEVKKLLKIINLSKSFNKETDNEINIFNNFNLKIEKK